MMRRLLIIALLVSAWTLHAPTAHADGLPKETRAMAERAFITGRLDGLETTLASATAERDRYPLLLRDGWWRSETGAVDVEPPYPESGGGAASAWPLLRALAADRALRESVGPHGLPEASPLYVYASSLDEQAFREELYYLDDVFRLMRETYGEPVPPLASERRSFERLRNTAMVVALGSLGAFVVLTFFGALIVTRTRKKPRASA